jgi:succinate-semialdehyde dehydrogenase/glutarate-semialdehyde dehydrogenase
VAPPRFCQSRNTSPRRSQRVARPQGGFCAPDGGVEKCAATFEYYAENGSRFVAPELVPTEPAKSFVTFQPLGTILAVMPWNFPFWQALRCAAPALMAGNAIVLKHASNVCGCALAIEEVLCDAGFPPGLFQTVLLGSARAEALIDHPAIKAVTLTGSVPAGRAIAARAGARLKKTVLELGGSDPYVVLEDCDLEGTVESCVKSRLINSGQSCVAAKRFIVVNSILQEFEERFTARMAQEKMGDPLDDSTTVGPLARRDLRDELHDQVNRSLAGGARLLLGGVIPDRKGWYYPPTVLADVRAGIAAFDEETFGPVAAIIGVKDEAEAIRAANDSPFGLGAAVFTKDLERGERIATTELEAGNCFVNGQVRSDPRLPFGGVKDSGYGRELGIFGIREFVNIKTVVVDRPSAISSNPANNK